ncbi:type IX secretion system membrane protein PorP/SprF [Cryomorpha ignava]|uniref:Type IX secretion system membrane protein PorP/SprF n=1 Tax=Cryomorpha ignava TaxID=101383 RepID=A0A7K3WKZ9_9FLAO|nr:PorP/SprF family type IX secretion system membrane protein [Cryomorpha ignava]NEN22208.1 type IX secretion system membrane protein PorP/SprF [Cryomorpha ignava]
MYTKRNKKRKGVIPKFILGMMLVLPFFSSVSHCQDVQFSLPNQVPLYINPASAGEFDLYRAQLSYRSQWKSVGTPFTTMSGSFDMIIMGDATGKSGKGHLGAGLNFLTDKSGPDGQKVFAVNGSTAYHVQLTSTSTLGGGLNIGYDQRSLSAADGKWASQFNGVQYDPGISSGESFSGDAESNLDLGAGIVYHASIKSKKRGWNLDRKISLGAAAYHLGRINLSESQYLSTELKPRYSLFAALQLPFGEKIAALPQFYFQQQNGSTATLYGFSVKYLVIAGNSFIGDTEPMSIQAGIFMRNSNALTVNAGMDWSKYSLFLAYDFSMGNLKEYNSGRGGYELGLRWRMNERKKR